MSNSSPIIQVAVNAPGWGHWTRILALVIHLPQIHFKVYHTLSHVPLPKWINNVEVVSQLQPHQPIVCEHGWESARPYGPNDFSHSLCIRKISRRRPDLAGYDRLITVSDVDEAGDFPPVVLETKASERSYDSNVIVSSEKKNHQFLREKYPAYSHQVIYPITVMRNSIKHLIGIAGYNLFWECAYYQIPCKLYPSTWLNDSHRRLARLGKRALPAPFINGAPSVARTMLEWWTEVAKHV
ncbi:hypothetical protein [Synechococcus sp. PCC 7336]|uniref:hypothetical protein n=1 Tax=Synechococcus sp. PCC 7336 TaxID=195250 RepID=UPI0012EA65C5|nr:hypothetical protein [Synechococcus sp. PCC 7336]